LVSCPRKRLPDPDQCGSAHLYAGAQAVGTVRWRGWNIRSRISSLGHVEGLLKRHHYRQNVGMKGLRFFRLSAGLAGCLLGAWVAMHPAHAQSCVDDYLTIEMVRGTILEIRPAPDPFKTADIYFTGPSPCDRMWMQVLKSDAARCRTGAIVEATGVITSDPENNAWQIGSPKNEFMVLGQDFSCS